MDEKLITTSRGIKLSVTFAQPTQEISSLKNTIVIFVHDFLSERTGGHSYDVMASIFRKAGYATLQFDFSGVGESEDDIITLKNEISDLYAVSKWCTENDYDNQYVVSTAFGSTVALQADLENVKNIVTINPVTVPLTFEWQEIFTDEQLEQLERQGQTKIFDDTPTSRKYFVISKQTLADLTMIDPKALFDKVKVPILVVTTDNVYTQEAMQDFTQTCFHLLRDGSQLKTVRHSGNDKNANEEIAHLCLEWFNLRQKLNG